MLILLDTGLVYIGQMPLRPVLTPAGAAIAVRRTEVRFASLAAPVSVLECASEDEVLELALTDGPDKVDAYGATLWPSSYVATRSLLRAMTGRPSPAVTELGCGPGLPSLAALAAGARSVAATDHSPLALALVLRAATDYQPDRARHLATAVLDCTDPAAMPLPWEADFLVAADLLYEEATAEALGERVARQVACGSTAIITEPGRQRGRGRAAFLRGVRATGLIARRGAEQLRFVDEPVPQRWCGREEPCRAVGVCVLEPTLAVQSSSL